MSESALLRTLRRFWVCNIPKSNCPPFHRRRATSPGGDKRRGEETDLQLLFAFGQKPPALLDRIDGKDSDQAQ